MQLPGQGGLDAGEDERNWFYAGNNRCPLHITCVLEELQAIHGHTHNYMKNHSKCKVKFKTAREAAKLRVTSAMRGGNVRAWRKKRLH